jgi:hypothetical protein
VRTKRNAVGLVASQEAFFGVLVAWVGADVHQAQSPRLPDGIQALGIAHSSIIDPLADEEIRETLSQGGQSRYEQGALVGAGRVEGAARGPGHV